MNSIRKIFIKWFDLQYIAKNMLIVLLLGMILLVFTYFIFIIPIGIETEYTKAAIAGIFAICAAALTGFSTHEDGNRQIALRYVTDKRVGWLNNLSSWTAELCELYCKYINLYREICNGSFVKKEDYIFINEIYSKIIRIISELYLHYNFTGGRDRIILQLLQIIEYKLGELHNRLRVYNISEILCTDEDTYIRKALELLVKHSQIYYKLEWERIKDEVVYAGNVNVREKIIKKAMVKKRLKLYEEQINFNNISKDNLLDNFNLENVYNELSQEKY